MAPLTPSFKIHTFLDMKHLHGAWVFYVARYWGGLLGNRPAAFTLYNVLAFSEILSLSHTFKYFQSDLVKSVLGTTGFGEGY
jgi:hypothetical protein